MHWLFLSICLALPLTLVALVSSCEAETPDNGIQWRTDYAAAQQEARQANKAMLLFFTGSDWCVYCKKLEEAAFHDAQFVKSIESSFVPVMLDFPSGFELEEELLQQNDQLKERYGVNTYPTMLFTDDSGRVFGINLGYDGDKQKLLTSLKQMDSAGKALTKITQAGGLDAVQDAQLLGDFLTQLSRSVIGQHWQGTLDRAIELASTSDSGLHRKLQEENKAIAAQVAADTVGRKIQEMFASGTSPEEQLKVLETMMPAAEKNDEVKKLVYLQYSAMLSHSGRYEESLAWAKKVGDAAWAGRRERFLSFDFQAKQHFRMGNSDEGMRLIQRMWDEYPGQPSLPKELWITSTAVQELYYAGQHQQCLEQAQHLLANSEPGSVEQVPGYFFGSLALAAMGTDFSLRGEYLEKLAPHQRSPRQTALTQAEAAVCYQAAGNATKSRQMIESIDKSLLNDADPKAQSKWQQAQQAALGTPADALRYLMTLRGAPKEKLEAKIQELAERT
ncbi:thioredoxin family protein [Bremerella sp. JC770]|uniref:thioredoxin family protein n=1 Tax=Bremerella sp. JC770 TaxID=3232137 RepID=UPI003457D12E